MRVCMCMRVCVLGEGTIPKPHDSYTSWRCSKWPFGLHNRICWNESILLEFIWPPFQPWFLVIFYTFLYNLETVSDFILGGSKITADGDCSHEIKRYLLLERKAMTNLGSILKSRDITLPTKVHLVKVMIFLVVMYGCESWTIKQSECPRIEAFKLKILLFYEAPTSWSSAIWHFSTVNWWGIC